MAASGLQVKVVIVGAGHAGGALATQLRHSGHKGDIVLVGDEAVAPYQRPPLSKAFLKGEATTEALKLRPDSYYGSHGIKLRLGAHATAIDRQARRLLLDEGEALDYDFLVLATGARPRLLPVPGAELDGIYALRSIADAELLKAVLQPGKRIAIVGGGYIGLEVAASARSFGADAVIIERELRVLARVACEELSSFFHQYHKARGVEIIENATVTGFTPGSDGFVSGVALADGRVLGCDAALIGVGAIPNIELALDAGLHCDNGIVVDLEARSSDPHIFAIGDVANRPMPLYGRRHRLESVPNALEQGKQAAAAICGTKPPAPEVPWFWSDQYELKLQIAGIPFNADRRVVRGAPDDGKFAIFHLAGDRLEAVEAVNCGAEFMAGRLLIGSQKPLSPQQLADQSISMKELAL